MHLRSQSRAEWQQVIWYSMEWEDFLRNDYRGSLGIFSTSQIISFGIVALGIALYFVIPKMMEKKE